jgi:hypothetical protein
MSLQNNRSRLVGNYAMKIRIRLIASVGKASYFARRPIHLLTFPFCQVCFPSNEFSSLNVKRAFPRATSEYVISISFPLVSHVPNGLDSLRNVRSDLNSYLVVPCFPLSSCYEISNCPTIILLGSIGLLVTGAIFSSITTDDCVASFSSFNSISTDL